MRAHTHKHVPARTHSTFQWLQDLERVGVPGFLTSLERPSLSDAEIRSIFGKSERKKAFKEAKYQQQQQQQQSDRSAEVGASASTTTRSEEDTLTGNS